MKYYLVLDLEMCRVPRNISKLRYPYRSEIIQIGAVMLNSHYEIVDYFESLVSPEFGRLDSYISNLTGIRESKLRLAPKLSVALERLTCWIDGRDVTIFEWSGADYAQLLKEVTKKEIQSPAIADLMREDRWVDYQMVFAERFDTNRLYSLADAILACGIEPEGTYHDGFYDAYNTALLIQKLSLCPELQLHDTIPAFNLSTEEFGFSLAGLLSAALQSA